MSNLAYFTEDMLKEIRAKAKIEDVISHYLPLEKKGRSLKCVCPFHDDHDPSMSISSEKQIFKCFVCGTGGNVFQFVQKHEQSSFKEAVIKVAELVDYTIDDSLKVIEKPVTKNNNLHKVIDESIKFTQFQLNSVDGLQAKDYLTNRNITDSQIEKFEIGYLSKSKSLNNFLTKKGIATEEMIQTDIAQLGDNGIYDVFFDRITFPIHDENGRGVGFTARAMNSDAVAKYINTAETPIYTKGNVVYNFHRAKPYCKKENNVILVEGPLDVYAFDRIDVGNVVSTLGTACTVEQLKLIRKLSANLVICYDGDVAGQNASYKTGELANRMGFRVSVAKNTSGLDPDELLKKYGKDELVAMITKPYNWVEFVMELTRKKYDVSNYDDRKKYVKIVMKEVLLLNDKVDREYFTNLIHKETNFTPKQLLDIANEGAMKNVVSVSKPTRQRRPTLNGRLISQFEVISQIMLSYEMFQVFKDELGFLIDPKCQKIVLSVLEYYRTNTDMQIASFLDYLHEDELKDLILEIDGNELFVKRPNKDVLLGAIEKVKTLLLDSQFDELRAKLAQANSNQLKLEIVSEYMEMLKTKMKLEE